MQHLILLLGLCFYFSSHAQTQLSGLNLSGIKRVKQTTYNYKNKAKNLTLIKESVYDTNQVLTNQERNHFMTVDTGFAAHKHYVFTYNPATKLGSYYTEQLEHSSKPNRKYSKQKATFKSYDHSSKREWVKVYKKNSKLLLRQTKKKFDTNGHLINTEITYYDSSPPRSSKENVSRNAAGNIISWASFDDDGDTKSQARQFTAKYKHDTLLLESSGYLYFNWNQTINKFNGKNELKKTISNVGTRQSTGKVKINDQTITIYKYNKPFKTIEKKLKKKVKTIVYSYTPTEEVQQITTPEKTYTEKKVYSYADSAMTRLVHYTETLDGKPFLDKTFTYHPDTTLLASYTEVEFRKNGQDWKTVRYYDMDGNYTKQQFFVANKLNKEDIYTYEYHPQPEEEVKEEE